jgi:hypothetical protein
MNFGKSIEVILKKWYTKRIEEETEKNRKLKELHDTLTKIKI